MAVRGRKGRVGVVGRLQHSLPSPWSPIILTTGLVAPLGRGGSTDTSWNMAPVDYRLRNTFLETGKAGMDWISILVSICRSDISDSAKVVTLSHYIGW